MVSVDNLLIVFMANKSEHKAHPKCALTKPPCTLFITKCEFKVVMMLGQQVQALWLSRIINVASMNTVGKADCDLSLAL